MSQDLTYLYCRKVEYPLDSFSKNNLELFRAKTDPKPDHPLLEFFLQGLGVDSKPSPPFEGLIQLEFTLNGKTFLFPNFDNIFSRPKSVRNWWFLPPELEGKTIYQSEEDINNWWEDFQKIYDSSILTREENKKIQMLFIMLSMSNRLVESLFHSLLVPPPTRVVIDEEDLIYSSYYCYRFFCDHDDIRKNWRYWLLQKAIINYYHIIFVPSLLEKHNSREIIRLSNRFPEYARANSCLLKFREDLYRKCDEGYFDKRYVDEFFKAQSIETKNTVLNRKKESGELQHIVFGQCRVCGAMFPVGKVVGDGKGKGMSRKICSGQKCEKAWDLFRKSLPPIPILNDPDGGMILISHL
jgi:hypothetical protein